jgi:tryptophan synthase alpha chain
VTGTTGERAGLDAGDLLARVKAHFEVPVALGFGISTPEHAAAAVAAGAEGVIVGTRLVRAAAEGDDVRALVEGLAAALARPDA